MIADIIIKPLQYDQFEYSHNFLLGYKSFIRNLKRDFYILYAYSPNGFLGEFFTRIISSFFDYSPFGVM